MQTGCLVDQEPMQERGHMIGLDVLGKFALEFYSCAEHNLGRIILIGKTASNTPNQWTDLKTIDKLEQLEYNRV